MARVTLGTGETITVGGVTEIFGTSGAQSVTVIDGSTITFRSGFNSGGDNIRLTGTASNFVMSFSGSNVTLFSAVDNITIVIPVGAVANTITFDNGDVRSLSFVNGVPTLGAQAATATATPLTAGAGTFTVAASGDGTEGDVVTFTVTRTDTTSAETLQYTVQGSTNGGTVVAATAGADFTAAGNSVSFAAGAATATFTVALNTDNAVEGIEGYGVSVLKGATVVATDSALVLDANNVGQTFVLTSNLDRVGTGSALDLVGSEGSTSTVGNDTIIGTQGGAFTPEFNTFDNINGGAGYDTMVVLDNGAPFTAAPSFANVTIANVEELNYTSQRGFNGGALNTTPWAGLELAEVNLIGFGTQVLTMDIDTSAVVDQEGSGDLYVYGGGGTLAVEANDGDVNVGTNGATNSFTAVSIEGGYDVTVEDWGLQQLATVNLDGFGDDATVSGAAVSAVSVTNIFGGPTYRDLNVDALDTTVTLTNISVTDFDVTASDALTVNADGNTLTGIDDITAGTNAELNVSGYLGLDDVAANGVGATVTLNAIDGGLSFDSIQGGDVRQVVITGQGYATMNTVTQSGDSAGTVITSTNAGGVSIYNQLGDNTQFAGSGNTGGDYAQFGANTRANSFGGGNDQVQLNSPNLGLLGSIDGGAGTDTLIMNSNNAAAFTVALSATSNFETLYLTGQPVGTADVINLANIGFTGYPGANTTDVDSAVGATAPVTEVVTVSFLGVSSWTDSVTFDGETATFADGMSAIALAAEFVADLGGSTANWTLVDNLNGTVTMTAAAPGVVADLTAGSFVFTDATTVGKPGFEQASPVVVVDGVAPVAATTEQYRLTLDSVTVLNGQTVTFTSAVGPTTYTFTAAADLTQSGEALQDALVAWNGITGRTITKDALTGDILITANSSGTSGDLTIGGTGISASDTYTFTQLVNGQNAVAANDEDVFFLLDGVSTGNDQIVFDGVTITLAPTDDTPGELRTAFINQYNAAPVRTYVASNSGLFETYGFLQTGIHLESLTNADLPNVTSGSFVFVDDTNVGTPSVGVTVNTQGSTASVTLNNFTSGSTLSLLAALGTHIVNVNANTAADVLNLDLEVNGGNHGSVTADQFETVNINTINTAPGADTLSLVDASLKTLVVTGGDGLTIDTNSTVISSINASGLGGQLVWSADANTVPITVSTGTGGSVVDFSAMAIQGLAPITFLGGSGNDTVTLGGLGSSRATITTGGGNDEINVGQVDGGNDYSTIIDFDVTNNGSIDTLDFDAAGSFVAIRDQELEPTALFQDYLDQAASNGAVANGAIHWFFWDGDTYVVQDNADGEDFQDGVDVVIKLEGELELTSLNFV